MAQRIPLLFIVALLISPLYVHLSWSFSPILRSYHGLSKTMIRVPDRSNGISMSTVTEEFIQRLKSRDRRPSLEFNIKQALSNDLEAIVSLRVSTFYPEVCGPGMSNEPMKRRVFETLKRRERDGSVNFVALEDGGIFFKSLLGSVEISPSDFKGTDMEHVGAKKKLYLVDLCIKESVRNMGIASGLLRNVEEYAVSREFQEVYMHVETGNVVARNLYSKNGYMAHNCDKSKAFTVAKLKRPAEDFILLRKMLPSPSGTI